MADKYIDYFEIDEYGGHFSREAKVLIGAYDGVKVEVLISEVDAAVAKVIEERRKAGLVRDELAGGRTEADAAAAELREVLGRFFSYLSSLNPKKTPFSFEAFFSGKNLGNISQLKGEDLRARADQVLVGFDATSNAGLPGKAEWRQELSEARDALAQALGGKGQKSSEAGTVTAALKQAREDFLDIYNGGAKPIVRGLLNRLGRGAQYKNFFKDLQIHEPAPAKKKA